jgi:hypothetical protein
VPPLVRLLGDEEDKTRGNLVRNSAALCGDLVQAGEFISISYFVFISYGQFE